MKQEQESNGLTTTPDVPIEPTLIFVHVPKTAGTTLNRVIESQYNPTRIYSIPGGFRDWSIERFKRLPESRRRNLQVLKGHMGFGLHRLFPQPTTYLTMLRDPVSRSISSYHYAMSNRFHPLHRIVTPKSFSLSKFLDLALWEDNLQCKLIGGLPMAEVRPRTAVEAARRGDISAVERFAGLHCTDETLAAAKKNLETHFSVVGLTEHFDKSLALMALNYGWVVPIYNSFRRSRTRPRTDTVSAATRSQIEHRNSFDLELYEFGRELFRVAVERRYEEIEFTLEAFRRAKHPGELRSLSRAAVAWGRFGVSLVRSSI